MKDSKKISNSELKHLELKKKKMEEGRKIISNNKYLNQEFAN